MLEQLIFGSDYNKDWHMLPGERAALLFLLQLYKPQVSIEIGTFRGGSLRPISALSEKVYTFDIDASQHRMAPLNVEFVTGDTANTLDPVVSSLNDSGDEVNFILIDGSHEERGVLLDVNSCLKYKPKKRPCVIVMHDSWNPAVRSGIMAANWGDCVHAHGLDLDFVPGILQSRPDIAGQIWGGLAVALLLPEVRTAPFQLQSYYGHSRNILMSHSVHKPA